MLTALVAALSLASTVTLDVPYVPQTELLCGGAAASMVFRYWGDAHADVQQFATLVDRRAGGIADAALIDAVQQRGWRTDRFTGSIAALTARLYEREPVIVLLADGRNRLHYVVVTGVATEGIVVHDPSRGPARSIANAEFERLWKPSGFWSLVILPGDAAKVHSESALASSIAAAPAGHVSWCDELLETAVSDIRRRGISEADVTLDRVRAECPAAAGPIRELAAVRFAQGRWSEATSLARQALNRRPDDAYAWDVLGSSLFMQHDDVAALRAWNHIGKPRLDVVKVEGLARARYQSITAALALDHNSLLTADAFERARHRLDELPDRVTARLSLRPEADGFATVDVVIVERAAHPNGAAEWTATAARSVVDREITATVPGVTGQGELWTASWRWWNERPRAAFSFAAPRAGRFPGVSRVDASWEEQTYSLNAAGALLNESRLHGGFTISDWMTGRVRYSMMAGVDVWNEGHLAPSLSGSIERRFAGDRVAVNADATTWLTSGERFNVVSANARYRSTSETRGLVYLASAGIDRASDAAPLGLWPGAGDGYAREALLRAHPLLHGGIIDVTQSAFGRTLAHATVEADRWFERPFLPRVGVAAFADLARATRTAPVESTAPLRVDVGGGLRMKVPGWQRVLRVDVAHGLSDGHNAITVGWMF
jgi:hypothetical protein